MLSRRRCEQRWKRSPEKLKAIHNEILDFYTNKTEEERSGEDDEIKQIHDEILAFYVSSSVARHKKVAKNARLMNNSKPLNIFININIGK